MDRSDSSLIQSLLAKNVSFCLYRFPFEKEFRLALEKKFLPFEPEKYFWVAPFVSASSAGELFLHPVEDEFDNDDIIQITRNLPDAPLDWQQLPEHTSREEYLQRIEIFLEAIKQHKMQKAILSRVKKIEKPDDFDPLSTFKKLCIRYPQAFVHLMYHNEGGMWIGATPELLLLSEKNYLTTMAVAGTQPVNKEHHYVWEKKEQEEHHFVEQHIESVFAKHHIPVKSKDGPKTIEAGYVAHLKTKYDFYNENQINLKDLLKDLHPTPAVGGLPVAEGINFILQHEGYDRRYYCGFLGETDFVNKLRVYTNLRCMQIGKNEIAIYCGGGITADSNPESEWEETVLKSRTMLDTLKELNKNEVVR